MSIAERQTILHMRVCGKILKRELRKEDKRNREMTNQYITHLLDEQAHSAESDESSIDSASVNCLGKEIGHVEEINSGVQEAIPESLEKEMDKVAEKGDLSKVSAESSPSASVFLGCLFLFYLLCIMINDI